MVMKNCYNKIHDNNYGNYSEYKVIKYKYGLQKDVILITKAKTGTLLYKK